MNPHRTRRPCSLRLAPLLALSFALVSCKNKNGGSDVELDPPSYAELAAAHNERAALLETMYAYGVVEIEWRDDDGKHSHQGDLDVWLRMPDSIALQVGKMGERFLWLGGNSEASWFFDLRREGETFAEIYGPSATITSEGDVPLALSMTALLEMMGLAQIPEEKPPAAPDVTYDQERSAWVLTTESSTSPMRLFFDVKRSLPVRVELLESFPPPSEVAESPWRQGGQVSRADSPARGVGGTQELVNDAQTKASADANLILYSVLRLQHYEYIFMKGRANDQFPLVPTLIDVYRGDDTGSLKISVSRPVAEDESFQDNYFDLDWLLQVLQPDEVRDYRSGRDRGTGGRGAHGAESNTDA